MESGTVSLGNNFGNGVGMVNGLTPTFVNAGDVLTLELVPSQLSPVGTLAGVTFTIDFLPVPEPSATVMLLVGGWASAMFRRFRGR